MIARQWRPLIVTIVWLLICALAIWFSPRCQVPTWPDAPAASGLLRALGLSPDPALLVFHRSGGLAPDDQAYVEELLKGPLAARESARRYGASSAEPLVLAVAAQPEDVPQLRAMLQGHPDGLTARVTGMPAFAYDAVSAWERSRPLVLAVVVGLTALVALLGRLGLVRALVVAASAGAAGLVTSTLAALFAAPAPLALATVLSASLAAAGAARLLLGLPLSMRTSYPRPPAADLAPAPEAPAAPAREIGPLERMLIVSGEMALQEAFVVIAGLVGFVVDYRAGAALLVGVAVAAVANLSVTPALVALFTRPRRTLPPLGRTLRLWARIGLVLLPIAGLCLLAPTVRPQDLAARGSDAVAGHELLSAAGTSGGSAVAPGRLMPIHLLIHIPGDSLDAAQVTAVQGLLADLRTRRALAAVEGEVALPPPLPDGQLPAQLAAALARLEETSAAMQTALSAQGEVLSAAAADLQGLDLAVNLGPIETTLSEAGAGLESVRASLSETNGSYARIPIEFPEIASRIDHVPTLRRMPATLETAIAGLDDVTVRLRQAVTLTQSLASDLAGTSGDELAARVQSQLADVRVVLEELVSDTVVLRGTLDDIETLLAEAAAAAPPTLQGEYQTPANLLRIVLVPAAGPFAPATLGEVRALQPLVEQRLAGGPLADSVITWGGVPVTAAALQAQWLPGLLLQGLFLTVVALVLAAWVATSRLGTALLLTAGAVISAAAGIGVAAAVFREVDSEVLLLAAIALVALSAGRLIIGRAPALEDLLLALPPLGLLLSGAPALMALGLALSAGLLASCFLVVPTLVRRPRLPAAGE